MSKVLVVVGHPDLSQSKHNAALVDAVRDLAHVTVHDLYAAYPDFQVDADAEQALLAEHDVIVFQHPVYWYNTPPLFRQWQDTVLTHRWAFTYDGTPSQLAGKKAIVAVTAGAAADAYTPEGWIKTTLEPLLSNWDATLRLCQFDIQPMFKLYGTTCGLTDEGLATAAKQYNELLTSFAA
ncbi:NAD(P)H-dependent oxidoreductase [Streptomyces tubercidicus]|uniref:NAD(P)H oxidoreductase n=1 Tax=Streptomyces tubercidicus TaxID=47759 RepID=A0A640UIA5_9ACTN|nr:NAD(P)H-dependent oxidoreductase [Streptomyces tubercidicus]WAU10662.1 NAD(P)H-dependent oxidoreductase [Streptomyces tubercidicus]GFE35793.1 NAD(P)H oxidoreductase [Streptomyces tubercidicus]